MAEYWTPKLTERIAVLPPVPLDPEGESGPTRGQARGPNWRRTSKGLYVPSTVDSSTADQRIVEEAARLGPGGAVTGWASLWMRGAAYFEGLEADRTTSRPVPLVSQDRQLRAHDGSTVSADRLADSDVDEIRRVRCTTARLALLHEVRGLDQRDAVVAVDMALAAELTSLRRLRAFVAGCRRCTGADFLGTVLGLASERSRSPAEVRLRLVWELDAHLGRPLVNQPLFSLTGELLGVPDLFDVAAGLVIEYDGFDHLENNRRRRDLAREEVFRGQGLEYVAVVAADLQAVEALVARLRSARDRALASSAYRPQSWTLTPPWGWVPFESERPLDDRLEERELLEEVRAEAD